MKTIIKHSLLSVILLSSVGYTGTIEVPVENAPIPIVPAVDTNSLYVGLGVSAMSLRDNLSDEEFSTTGIMLQLGYEMNPYIALEGRYSRNVGNVKYDKGLTTNPNFSDYPTDFSNIALYVKPMYPIAEWNIYALLGYGQVKLTNIPLGGAGISADRAESGFQWGLGTSYDVAEDIDIYLDYVRFYDDTGFDFRATTADVTSDAWTFGISYKF